MDNDLLSRLFAAVCSAPSAAPVAVPGLRHPARVVALPHDGLTVFAYDHVPLIEVSDDTGVVAQVHGGLLSFPGDVPAWGA